jgi:hypothetical protein
MKIPKLLYVVLFLALLLGFLTVWNATYSIKWIVEKSYEDGSTMAVIKYNKITDRMSITGFNTKDRHFRQYDLSKEEWPTTDK